MALIVKEYSPEGWQSLMKARTKLHGAYKRFCFLFLIAAGLAVAWILFGSYIRYILPYEAIKKTVPWIGNLLALLLLVLGLILVWRLQTVTFRIYTVGLAIFLFFLAVPCILGLFLVPRLAFAEISYLASQQENEKEIPEDQD